MSPHSRGTLGLNINFEIWGQWIYGNQISKANSILNYAGRPSLFQEKTLPPQGFEEVSLQVLAVDKAGKFGPTHPFLSGGSLKRKHSKIHSLSQSFSFDIEKEPT